MLVLTHHSIACLADAAVRFRNARLFESRPRSTEALARNRFAAPLFFTR
jgi:hypothetical protein